MYLPAVRDCPFSSAIVVTVSIDGMIVFSQGGFTRSKYSVLNCLHPNTAICAPIIGERLRVLNFAWRGWDELVHPPRVVCCIDTSSIRSNYMTAVGGKQYDSGRYSSSAL